MRRPIALCSVAALAAACTSNAESTTGGPRFGAGDTAVCVALGADYRNNVGTIAAVALPSLTVTRQLLLGVVSGDPVLRADGDRLLVVNRSANNVTVVDVPTWSYERQLAIGAGANPQDAALAGDKLYVAAYGLGTLPVFDVRTGAKLAAIDLSSYDPDGVPNANSVVVVGDRAYVTLDLLDTAALPKPRGKGRIVVIDTKTDTIEDDFDLTYENPYGFMFPRGDKLLVATLADFSGTSGCVEQVVPGGSASLAPCLVQNADLGGTVSAIAVGPQGVYLAVSSFDAMFNQTAELRELGGDGALKPQAMTPTDQLPTDVAYAPSGQLVYADQMGGGLRVFDLASRKELTTKALDIGLTPAASNGIVCMAR